MNNLHGNYELSEAPMSEDQAPSLIPFSELLGKKFKMVAGSPPITVGPKPNNYQPQYFEFDANAFIKQQFTISNSETAITISDITSGGLPGDDTIETVIFSIGSPVFNDNKMNICDLVQELFKPQYKSCSIASGWHWGKAFNFTFNILASAKIIDGVEVCYLCNHKFTRPRQYGSANPVPFSANVNGVTLNIQNQSAKALTFLNPYTLESRFKPLNKAPSKWDRKMLVRALVNGQFKNLRCNYAYTNDFKNSEGVCESQAKAENPIQIIETWVTKSRNKGTFAENNGEVRFSNSSKDSYQFDFVLNNRYPSDRFSVDDLKAIA